jgi:hypothetical protein
LSAKSLKWSNKATTTLQELSIESLFQADAATEAAVRAAAAG